MIVIPRSFLELSCVTSSDLDLAQPYQKASPVHYDASFKLLLNFYFPPLPPPYFSLAIFPPLPLFFLTPFLISHYLLPSLIFLTRLPPPPPSSSFSKKSFFSFPFMNSFQRFVFSSYCLDNFEKSIFIFYMVPSLGLFLTTFYGLYFSQYYK